MPIKAPIPAPGPARRVAEAVHAAGGQAWLVGGTVRDAFLGRPAHDLDLEVHGLAAKRLEAVLRGLGATRKVGRSFGVFKVRIGRETADVSLPRADSATAGARGAVMGDPHLGLEEAARRRDLSINAMAWDPRTGEVFDPCGGLADLRAGLLRAAWAPRFGDDPLRALRVVRFAGVLGFAVAPELADLCRALDPGAEAAERQLAELEKLWLGAETPGAAARVAVELGVWPRVFPALDPGAQAAREAALDRAATQRPVVAGTGRKLALLWAALLHADAPAAAEATLDRLKVHRHGGYPVREAALAAARSWRLLVAAATDAELRRLAEHAEVDLTARVAHAATGAAAPLAHAGRAAELGVSHAALAPLLTGRDLRDLGMAPGPGMGAWLQRVREEQLAGELASPEAAIAWVGRLWSTDAQTGRAPGSAGAPTPPPADRSEPS